MAVVDRPMGYGSGRIGWMLRDFKFDGLSNFAVTVHLFIMHMIIVYKSYNA